MEGLFKDCGYNVFTDDNTSKIVKENIATDAWYKNEDQYDYKTGKVKKGKDEAKMKEYTQLMWKKSEKVGFGIKGKFVVAWYCPKGNTAGVKDYKKNVCKKDGCKLCLEDKAGKKYGYDKCYNDLALERTNIDRGNHDAKKVELSEDLAKEAQKHAEKVSGAKAITKSDASVLKKCWENIYELDKAADEFDLGDTDMALKFWNSKKSEYDFKLHKEKTGKSKADSDKFTATVWKANKKVGFGISGKYVVGWYCDEPNTSVTDSYKDNVSKNCYKDNDDVDLGYNSCYNTAANDAHNLKRVDHGTDKLALDFDIAKAA